MMCNPHFLLSLTLVCLIAIAPSLASKSGHGKAFGSSGPFLQLDQVESLSTRAFFQKYVVEKRPVVLHRSFVQSPAYKIWSDEYLSRAARGHSAVKMVVETEKKESRDQEILHMSLDEFLLAYKNRDIYLVNEVSRFLGNQKERRI